MAENVSTFGPFTLIDGFLFKDDKLFNPKSPLKDLIIKKAYKGALTSYFDIYKSFKILKDCFYFPKMGEDVHKVVTRCVTCHTAKIHFHSGFYTHLPIPTMP